MNWHSYNTENIWQPLNDLHYGYILRKFDKKILEYIKPSVDEIIQNPQNTIGYQDKLVGQIHDEFAINLPDFFIDILKDTQYNFEEYSGYFKNYHYLSSVEEINPRFDYTKKIWINFQRKYEYNPIHFHKGLYSWVFWYQIPYTLESELKSQPLSPNFKDDCQHGQFHFVSSRNRGGIDTTNIPCYNESEGTLLFFPSSLEHTVYPFFSSNDYRITIAGNIHLDEINPVYENNAP